MNMKLLIIQSSPAWIQIFSSSLSSQTSPICVPYKTTGKITATYFNFRIF